MFSTGVSKVSFPNGEVYYVSPIYKKDKIKAIRKIKPNKNPLTSVKEIKLSKMSRTTIKDLFGDLDIDNVPNFIYDGGLEIKYLTDLLFMGNYIDDVI